MPFCARSLGTERTEGDISASVISANIIASPDVATLAQRSAHPRGWSRAGPTDTVWKRRGKSAPTIKRYRPLRFIFATSVPRPSSRTLEFISLPAACYRLRDASSRATSSRATFVKPALIARAASRFRMKLRNSSLSWQDGEARNQILRFSIAAPHPAARPLSSPSAILVPRYSLPSYIRIARACCKASTACPTFA